MVLVFKWPLGGYLNELGYHYFSARRKGILSDNDKKLRLQFARNIKQEMIRNPDFWKNEISFTWMGYSLFTSITRIVVRPQTEPGCGENERKGLKLQAKDVKILLVDGGCMFSWP